VVRGRTAVVREIRAAGRLLTALRAPVTARGPWLICALYAQPAPLRGCRPVAVVVDGASGPAALAALELRGAGARVTATLLGDGLPVPPGAAPARLPARDDAAAGRLAAGVLQLLDGLRRPWTLRLTGLPMGDPTVRAIGQARPEAAFANTRSARLVDALDGIGPVRRSRDPRELEHLLPALLARAPDRRARTSLRAAARLHAALGSVEVAVVADGDRVRAGLLTLLDGDERRPWWGFSDVGGLVPEPAAPVAGLTLRGPGRLGQPA
jgi:hypothetical protein